MNPTDSSFDPEKLILALAGAAVALVLLARLIRPD